MTRFWKNFNGEPYLINPHLISLNPRRKTAGKTKRRISIMSLRRNRKGQFLPKSKAAVSNPRRRRAYSAPKSRVYKRRSPRRNVYFGNPRRSYRKARRNPISLKGGKIFMGMSINDILYAGAGFIAPPAVEGVVKGFLPVSITGNAFGKWAIKAASVAGVSFLGSKFLGREAGKMLAIGGATYLLAAAVVEFIPTLFSGFSGYAPGGKVVSQGPRPVLAGQPYLGRYIGAGGSGAMSLANVPARVDPAARF